MLKFDKTGKLMNTFGVNDFQIPHSLALAEDLDLICAADRENMRYLSSILSSTLLAVYSVTSLTPTSESHVWEDKARWGRGNYGMLQ